MAQTTACEKQPEEFFFLTLTTYRRRNVFINDSINSVLCEALDYHIDASHVHIAGFVIMPDHIHIIASPLEWTVPDFVNNFKAYTGIKVKSLGGFSKKVWRRRFFNISIEDESDFKKKLTKIHNNPLKKKLTKKPEDYKWSSAANYRSRPGVIRIVEIVGI